MRIFIKLAFCFIILSFPIIAQSASSNELTTFVNNSIKQLNESSLKIPYFEKAEVDEIQTISKVSGNILHLCWLKNDKGRVGYIAVIESKGSFKVISLSATTATPDYFLKYLKIEGLPDKQLNYSSAKQISFVENVPLVATAKTLIGTDSIEISEIASSLSSLFNHLQYAKKGLYFGHSGFSADPEYKRRFKEDPASTQYPDDIDWKSFDNEIREALEQKNIPKGQTPEQRANSSNQQRNIIKPIIRRRLLNPLNAKERLDVINSENSKIEVVTLNNISSGMVDAILLQQDYLNSNGTELRQNLNTFFKTRGRTAKIETIPFEKIQPDSLPTILLGPDNIAAVLLGYINIDNERFASVFFPNTGAALIMTMTEKKRQIRLEAGLPAEPNLEEDEEYQKILKQAKEVEEMRRKLYEEKGLPDPQPKSVEQRLQEGREKTKETEDNTFITEDHKSKYPEGFKNGIHLINCTTLSSWQVLTISNIQVGDNW